MRRFALILALWPGFLAADEFRQLSGGEILSALIGKKLGYGNGAWQTFDEVMLTQYFSGGPSAGRWAVREERYCSQWPPSDLWACYDFFQNGETIRFVGDGGDFTDGTYVQ
ncbi:hypothetical protein HW561_07675 [Rhodobacteraceae bacterium B1Z28]|uniref:Beta/gamma crystallin n=1 Tax=Ruegeria haliotis TaxID=2747601 RepID=A0ABX2PNE8_9RHOB|nr:hypothetical protein [Ruegeria haliotis]NVO55665.1 hypothetical protein [Ruegeria haliotis]